MRSTLTVSIIGGSVGAIIVVTWYIYRSCRKKRIEIPDVHKWLYVGTLKEVNLYPVKSCGGCELDSAKCDALGLRCEDFWDRCLVLIDNDGKIGFAGAYPKMLGIESEITSKGWLCLRAPNLAPLMLNVHQLINSNYKTRTEKRKSGYRLQLIECNIEHHIWFSNAVLNRETGMRLYISIPIIEKSIWYKTKADLMPFMVLHDRSVSNLNSQLANKNHVHHKQFRSNFLVESHDSINAFDEDRWEWLRIGDVLQTAVILRFNSPCFRCILPNINIETCERNADFEPLRTLRKFRPRSYKNEPEMGVYFDLYKEGSIKKGDEVYIQYRN